ncbi:hypothetical protein O9X81_24380 [Agrobacterium salinitolerans]|uniref:hypothetical protein n=1 Tax=Agrobacterium salinitolerans TaxID=1183413 RepID=UPI0022B828AC|nr:hypothetical protein [Agrobacterium salinitolerans]MCZ7859737.1 hypothetical protein [Agrobacterium salinitolerans]
MTLVAGISIGGLPAFVGDLLLSWGMPSEVDLPTLRSPGVFPGIDKDYAAGLAQKLIIVRPYLLIAWAGLRREATRIVEELDAILPRTKQLEEHPKALFEILNSCREGTEIVALVMAEASIFPLCVRTRGFEIDEKRVYLLGSGASDFFSFLNECPELVPSQERADGLLARTTMLRFAARAMAFQFIGKGLENSWGGGFEVAYPTSEGFQKIDRLMFRAWKLHHDGTYEYSGHSFFSRYVGQDLLLSRFNPEERTYLVRSPLDQPTVPKAYEKIWPAWTFELFILPSGQLVEAARYHPDHRPVSDFVEYSHGALTGWNWDKIYVDKVARQAAALAAEGVAFKRLDY